MMELITKRTLYRETWKYNGETFVREGTDEWFTWQMKDDRGNQVYLFQFDDIYMELEAARRTQLAIMDQQQAQEVVQ